MGIGRLEALRPWRRKKGTGATSRWPAEPGVIGGMPQGGLDFGAVLNPEAMIQQDQHDFLRWRRAGT